MAAFLLLFRDLYLPSKHGHSKDCTGDSEFSAAYRQELKQRDDELRKDAEKLLASAIAKGNEIEADKLRQLLRDWK